MLFFAYILFILYWALEGCSAGMYEHYMRDTRHYKKIKIARYITRSLFVVFAFGLVYFYTKSLSLSIPLIISFLLGAPNFYYGLKYTKLAKLGTDGYYLGWFDSKFEDHEVKIRNSRSRIYMLAISCALLLGITITKIYYL